MAVPQKLSIELLYDSTIPILGISKRNEKNISTKNVYTSVHKSTQKFVHEC